MVTVGWIVLAIFSFEYAYSALMWARRAPSIDAYPSPHAKRTFVVFPGFSNPAGPLGIGMSRLLNEYGPMIFLRQGSDINFNHIYRVVMDALQQLNGPREISIYGHSMGGQLGEQFREQYEREGSPFGPIRELFLDCTPGRGRSLGKSPGFDEFLRVFLKPYWGGPIGALIVAIGNLASRIGMPAPLSPETDKDLYRLYAHGLMWYNNRAWVAQMKYMLNYRLPERPPHTATRVIYIGAADMKRDDLVNQAMAKGDWSRVYPEMVCVQHAAIGHAWPMEQPVAYEEILRKVLSET